MQQHHPFNHSTIPYLNTLCYHYSFHPILTQHMKTSCLAYFLLCMFMIGVLYYTSESDTLAESQGDSLLQLFSKHFLRKNWHLVELVQCLFPEG